MSKHFTLKELIDTQHGVAKNIPSFEVVNHLNILATKVLEPIREIVGKCVREDSPVYINSGYRTPEINRLVGGAAGSLHLYGRAADIRFASTKEDMKQVFNCLQIDMPWLTECIYYEDKHFIHVAYAPELYPKKHYFAVL